MLSSFLVGLVILHSLSSLHPHRLNNRYTQFQIRNHTHFTLPRQAIIITSMQLTGIYLCTTAIFITHTYTFLHPTATDSIFLYDQLSAYNPSCLLILFFSPSLCSPFLDSICCYVYQFYCWSLLVSRQVTQLFILSQLPSNLPPLLISSNS
jgi:hypothetical protein